jgi:ADP-ribosylglycohydrolase
LLPPFYADSQALAVQGIKDQEHIQTELANFRELQAPIAGSLHMNRAMGQFTPLGDQQLILLDHLIQEKEFSPVNFARDWHFEMKNYDGLIDEATKVTLANLNAGGPPLLSGSTSDDFGAAARISPLVWFYQDDLEDLVTFTLNYVGLTHHHPLVMDAAVILARTAFSILKGEEILPALTTVCEHFSKTEAAGLILSGLESDDLETAEAAESFGCGSCAKEALPVLGHLLGKYIHDSEKAFRHNLVLGGDSAGRGMALALLFGARFGLEALGPARVEDVQKYNHLQCLLES